MKVTVSVRLEGFVERQRAMLNVDRNQMKMIPIMCRCARSNLIVSLIQSRGPSDVGGWRNEANGRVRERKGSIKQNLIRLRNHKIKFHTPKNAPQTKSFIVESIRRDGGWKHALGMWSGALFRVRPADKTRWLLLPRFYKQFDFNSQLLPKLFVLFCLEKALW